MSKLTLIKLLHNLYSGAGGVGQAAINVCQHMGCKIFTTCSDGKREFLKKTFGLEDYQIANSRDTSFEDHILKETAGMGVDVVLNSLSESKLKASVNCLSDYGRFVEIGKYDILTNSLLDMSQFGLNKAFQTTCLAHLDVDAIFNKSPGAVANRQKVYDLLCEGIQIGAVKPLKTHLFQSDQVEDAFRFMASGKHIGKVVIKIREGEFAEEPSVDAIQQTIFHPAKAYIITGGLGGFGLELAYWMISRGAKKFVLSSRSGIKDAYQEISVRRMRELGAKVVISTKDVTKLKGAQEMIQEASQLGPVGGIFNLGMVLKDAMLENQSIGSFVECCAPKVDGTIQLDQVSRKLCPSLDYFVCFSSVVAGRGNVGQTNYGYANSVMERICEERKKDRLHGLAIQWGAVGDVGVVAEILGGNDVIIGGTSMPQRLPSCLDTLDHFLVSNHTVVSSIVKVTTKKTTGLGKGDILGTITHILGIKDPSSLDPNSTLGELGMDSLMAIEIKQGLERDYDLIMSTQEIRGMKIKDLKEMEGKVAKAGKEKSKKGVIVSTEVTLQEIVSMSKGNFLRLNEVDAGKPIFCFPPIEGSFRSLIPLCKHINRPVVGVAWTEDADNIKSIKDLVEYYIHLLKQNYPDSQYDLMGYDYGGLIALETAAQLQSSQGENSAKKIALIESSHDLIKHYSNDLLNRHKQNDEMTFNELLIEYLNIFYPLEESEKNELMEELIEMRKSKEAKLKRISDIFTSKLGCSNSNSSSFEDSESESKNKVCQSNDLDAAIDRFQRKLKMASTFELSRRKVALTIGLYKSSQSFTVSNNMDATYHLNRVRFLMIKFNKLTDDTFDQQIQEEGEEMAVEIMEGDHRTFIPMNTDSLGPAIDAFFVTVVCA